MKYSWGDEELYVRQLLNLLQQPTRYAVDVGAADGVTGSNTNFLFKLGYDGLVIEGNRRKLSKAISSYESYAGQISFLGIFVTPVNIVKIFESLGVPMHPDFISIDIDSFDLEIAESILTTFRPSVLCVEINERLPPPIKYELRRRDVKTAQRDLTMISSASLCTWHESLSGLSYGLHHLELNNLIAYDLKRKEFSNLEPRKPDKVYLDFSNRLDRDDLFPHNNFFFRELLAERGLSDFVSLSTEDITSHYRNLLASLHQQGVLSRIPKFEIGVGDFEVINIKAFYEKSNHIELPSERKIPLDCWQTYKSNYIDFEHGSRLIAYRNLNPGVNFHYFNDLDMDDYMGDVWGKHEVFDIYSKCKFGPMKADIWRYCILYERGGIYIDIDAQLKIDLLSITPEVSELLSFERFPINGALFEDHSFDYGYFKERNFRNDRLPFPNQPVMQMVLFFQKNHGILSRVIDLIVQRYNFYRGREFASPFHAILNFTGPVVFTRAVWDYADHNFSISFTKGIDYNGALDSKVIPEKGLFNQTSHYSSVRNCVIVD